MERSTPGRDTWPVKGRGETELCFLTPEPGSKGEGRGSASPEGRSNHQPNHQPVGLLREPGTPMGRLQALLTFRWCGENLERGWSLTSPSHLGSRPTLIIPLRPIHRAQQVQKPLPAFWSACVRTGLCRQTHPFLAWLPGSSFYLQKQGGAEGDQAMSESKEALRVGWVVPGSNPVPASFLLPYETDPPLHPKSFNPPSPSSLWTPPFPRTPLLSRPVGTPLKLLTLIFPHPSCQYGVNLLGSEQAQVTGTIIIPESPCYR